MRRDILSARNFFGDVTDKNRELEQNLSPFIFGQMSNPRHEKMIHGEACK
jgi:hypothetical protein